MMADCGAKSTTRARKTRTISIRRRRDSSCAIDLHLDERQAARDGRGSRHILDREHVDQLVDIGFDAVRGAFANGRDDGHARDARPLGVADGERFDVVRAAAEQRSDAVQHARLVLDVDDKGMQARRSLIGGSFHQRGRAPNHGGQVRARRHHRERRNLPARRGSRSARRLGMEPRCLQRGIHLGALGDGERGMP
jgi:hypothetical protein